MAIIKTLKIITHPQGARYNATLSTQPVIHVGDLDTVTSVFTIDTAFVGSVLIAEGPGNTGYNLSGTLTKTFVSGVATFTNVGIVPDSTNTALDISSASLSFVTTNLNIVTSNTFQISNASKLVVTSSPVPTTTTLGRVMQIPIKVQFKDVDDNDIPLSGISIVASAQGATMSGTTTLQSGVSGFVIFTQLTFSGGSQVVLTFSSQGMTSAVITINLIPTNIIKPRRSIVAGDPPVVGDIVPFEIAINIPDRQLWVADETGTPVLIVSGGSGGGAYLPLEGGTMTGAIVFDGTSGQYISKGTFDTSRGGNSGISLVCSIGYEFNWQAGWLRTTEQGSATPRSLYLDSGAGTSLKVWNASDSTGTTISHLGITYPDGTTQTTAGGGSSIVRSGCEPDGYASLLSCNGSNSFWVDDAAAHITTNFIEGQTTEHYWTFSANGSLIFPDNTVQTTASTKFTSGATAPTSPAQGDRWVNTTDAVQYTYYQTAWVQFNN